MDYGLKQLLQQTVTITPASSINFNNETTYGTPVSVAARIVYKTKLVRNDVGTEVISKCQVWVDGAAVVTTLSKITLPDSTVPEIIMVEQFPDETGSIYHKVIYT